MIWLSGSKKNHHINFYDFIMLFSLSGSSYFGKYTTTILKKYIFLQVFFSWHWYCWFELQIEFLHYQQQRVFLQIQNEWTRGLFFKSISHVLYFPVSFNIQCWWTKKLEIYWILILILLTLLFHYSHLFFLTIWLKKNYICKILNFCSFN